MSTYPKCPHCDIELEDYNHYDCYDTNDITVYYTTGFCPECGKGYRWEEIYTYNHFENFEEDE